MRGATSVIVQTHQILRLPRKMNLMIDPCHTWNAIYNARSNKCHCPNSPNPAPATQNDSPKYCKNFSKTAETSFPMRGRSENDPRPFREWSENDPRMIRPWNRHSATCLATEVTFHAHHEHFVLKNTTFRAPAIIPNFTEYCACHEKWHFNFTKYCACHAKWLSWSIRDTHETLFTMRGTTGGILQHHQILRLPRKMTLQHFKEISRKQLKRHFQCGADPRMIREWSETDPRMIREWSDHETVTPQPASQPRLLFTPTTSILYWKIQHFALRLSFQISPNTAPATKSDTSTSPNTAPATQNDSHDQSATHMKRYLQCAEQQVASSNITKYCACHAKWLSNISKKFLENSWNVISNAGPIREWSENDPRPIREWSENDPTMKPSLRNPPRNRGYFSRPPRAFCIEKYNISRSGYHSKFHRILRLPRLVTLQLHQILRLPRKMTLMINPRHTCAPAKKSHTSHTTLLYSSLVFATILLRISSLTNLISYESLLLRI